ncbi:NAD-dependent epimerase/dehydratase family protein [Paenibacillus sp. 481]|uniref:NAD-dependent epimerase/dehydratase family protein n=1 Tax=Paenibacillus sp. 481 TaxID=2835869 RepID=UPI001E524DC5|nr:NAD(P)-dependent oxidoreductase [Paenibacillus sp. 481]UHA73674.1 NAD(P)-dependent oxidoreductase [Paenibacillus sp. 481]
MEKVLVTGGTGWIGSYVVRLLLEKGYEVHATCYRTAMPEAKCRWHQVNLLCNEEVVALIHKVKPSHLVHLAWEAVPPQCYQALNNYYWVQSSMTLIRSFIECGGKRLLVAGTCAEYKWENGYLSEQVTPLSFDTPYATSKNTFRLWLQSYCEQVGLSTCWGRIFHVYGPHESGKRLISTLITSVLKNEEALCTHGNQARDFLYIRDVAAALITLLTSNIQGTVNIGSGQPVQVKQIAAIISGKIGGAHLMKWGAIPFPQREPLFVGADVQRLQKEAQWQPAYTLDAGLEETIGWWKSYLHV